MPFLQIFFAVEYLSAEINICIIFGAYFALYIIDAETALYGAISDKFSKQHQH